MSASKLVATIRKSGGLVWLDQLGRLNAEGIPESQMEELSESHDLIVALLREEIAAKRWENSGKDPWWWRVPEQAWTHPDQALRPLRELVRLWVSEACVCSTRCSTRASALRGEFGAWVGLGPDVATKQEFLEQLEALGWPSVDGWVDNICLAEDFVAAPQYENQGRSRSDEDESQECTPDVA